VREESHLDDMRAAIRGDFERLASRRGRQELMREPVPELEREPEPEPEPRPGRVAKESDEEEAPRRGLFARLLGL
jgi:hypothetical protein